MKSNAGFKGHLRGHGHQNEMKTITGVARGDWVALI